MQPSITYNICFGKCTTHIHFSKKRILNITPDYTLKYKAFTLSPQLDYVLIMQALADILYSKKRSCWKADIKTIMENFVLYQEVASFYRLEMTKFSALTTNPFD